MGRRAAPRFEEMARRWRGTERVGRGGGRGGTEEGGGGGRKTERDGNGGGGGRREGGDVEGRQGRRNEGVKRNRQRNEEKIGWEVCVYVCVYARACACVHE
jgi:hypothetical protein